MSEELAILFQVQEADTELARLGQALAGLDSGAQLESEVAAAEAELAGLREQEHAAERESLDRELELRTLEEKRKRFHDQLYSGAVRNPRQLSDLQEEVEMLSREIRKVEDRVLELMEMLEERRAQIHAREAELKELRERLEAVRGKYETTGGRLRQEIAELEARRGGLASQVSANLLRRYEDIRSRQGNLGVVKVTGNTCPGCRITFPSEVLKALRAGRPNLSCESCRRLLFWEVQAAVEDDG